MYLFFFFFFRYITFVHVAVWPFPDIHCTYLFTYINVCFFLAPTPSCVVSFHSLYTCFLYLYAIYYFCFTQRCLDVFCLKCFRNTGCQSLLAINSLLTKFFKSLCSERFYCIQQVSMSWVIYDFSHMFICLLWFCHGLLKGEIVKDIFCIIG